MVTEKDNLIKYDIKILFVKEFIQLLQFIIKQSMNQRVRFSGNSAPRKDSSQIYQDQYKSQESEDQNFHKIKNKSGGDKNKVRVLKKNLVYCIGLSSDIAKQQILEKYFYLGQYGKIEKIAIHKNSFNNKNQKGPSYSIYITYFDQIQASLAILALNNLIHNQRLIRASYGTTKYCTFFLKKKECPNLPQCYFLHRFDKNNEIDEKDQKPNKTIFETHQMIAEQIIFRNYNSIKNKYKDDKNVKLIFPSVRELLFEFVEHRKNQNPEKQEYKQKIKTNEQKCRSESQLNEDKSLQELELKKTYSVSTQNSPIKNNENLQQYITKLILNNCLKQKNSVRSKLWFAENKQMNDNLLDIKKYLVRELQQ